LERVRQAASKDKKLRFTALLHHIYDLEALRKAYLRLKKDRMRRLITRWLPLPSVCHPYPLRRMGVIT
jgi:hypothetical protein